MFTFLFIGLKGLSSGNGSQGEKDSSANSTQDENYLGPTNSTGTQNSGSSSDTDGPADPGYKEMTLLCTGDVMYHTSQIEAAYNKDSGTYDFTSTYSYIKNIVSSADYAVANFETTLAGEDYPYAGFPNFNAPDTGFNALVSAGFDMMLFANNHCYDTGRGGLLRTQEVFNKYDIDYIGTRMSKQDKTFKAVEVNGIKIGMLNSTDDLAYGNLSERTINGIKISQNDIALIDLFNHSLMNEFYASAKASIDELKADGADMIVYFIHWGSEYELQHNAMQESIAQELCNLGVDVIVGSHPHVIQDADVLTSQNDPDHKTVCFYSLGNLVSNQNRLTLGNATDMGAYTENGLIVIFTLRKYNDGRCVVTDVTTVPLWVHRYIPADSTTLKYDIIPIEKALQNPSAYGLENSSFGVAHATEALTMTNETLSRFSWVFDEEMGSLS
ncbi:MAG: CapA family protein [Clostridia bacterium]|nr:CapA family protein [Clostridia bacterium]